MSLQAYNWSVNATLPPHIKSVLSFLGDSADEYGMIVNFEPKTAAKKYGIEPTQLERLIKHLADLKIIGLYGSNCYLRIKFSLDELIREANYAQH